MNRPSSKRSAKRIRVDRIAVHLVALLLFTLLCYVNLRAFHILPKFNGKEWAFGNLLTCKPCWNATEADCKAFIVKQSICIYLLWIAETILTVYWIFAFWNDICGSYATEIENASTLQKIKDMIFSHMFPVSMLVLVGVVRIIMSNDSYVNIRHEQLSNECSSTMEEVAHWPIWAYIVKELPDLAYHVDELLPYWAYLFEAIFLLYELIFIPRNFYTHRLGNVFLKYFYIIIWAGYFDTFCNETENDQQNLFNRSEILKALVSMDVLQVIYDQQSEFIAFLRRECSSCLGESVREERAESA